MELLEGCGVPSIAKFPAPTSSWQKIFLVPMWHLVMVTPVPPNILSLCSLVTLCIDIMLVNKLSFLVTISCNIKFGTAKLQLNHQEDTVDKSIQTIVG